MEGNVKSFYKYCIVPLCKNTIRNTPDKIFFHVPLSRYFRQKWCKAMRRVVVSTTSSLYCCEDHFNIEKDTENYIQYKILMLQEGHKITLRLKKGVVPHIFHCQNNGTWERPPKTKGASKRKRQVFIEEDIFESAFEKDALDKFKRRLIRSVARLLVKENKSEDEVFEQMQKETGCNCKKLWDRMRALTVKKLQRLLSADDRSENIAAVGRMTLTDWLLFDLVVVHEDIDVIGKEEMIATKKDSKPLLELFVLVQRFNIEVRNADSLAEAWTAATIHYNSKGHQCSPMLMQLRWYQLKKFTRELFYNYWFTYRGSSSHLPEANKNQPTKLQRAIAKRFPKLILEPFMSWEEMIKKDLVIMPEVFEEKMRKTPLLEPIDENTTDVVIVEPEVETIELDDESDTERREDCETNPKSAGSDEQQNVLNSIIKVEAEDQIPEEYSFVTEDNIQEREREVLASIDNAELALDGVHLDCAVNENLNIKPNINTENYSSNTEEISEHNEMDNEHNKISDDNVTDLPNEENNTTLPQITHVIGNVDMSQIPQEPNSSDTEADACIKDNIKVETIELEDDIIEPTINTEAEDNMDSFMIKKVMENLHKANLSMQDKKTKPVLNIQCKKAIEKAIHDLKASFDSNTEVSELDVEIAKKANEYINKKTNQDIQHIESDDLDIEIAEKADLFIKSCKEKKEDNDIVMTDFEFADDGIEFIDDGIEFDDHEKPATTEDTGFPKPIIKSEESNSSENGNNEFDGDTGKFDLKLLMDPVVYTLKLDDMEVLKNRCIQSVKSDDLIKEIFIASKISSPKSSVIKIKEENLVEDDKEIYDDIFRHDCDENVEEPIISEEKKVKLSSYLLNKPRVRDYNFIKLCKNPDFNTRLKRLNVGFFSSCRNRGLLKECKPLTIDVSKAFEHKLIDGILYLKDSKTTQQDALNSNSDYEPADTNISTSQITMQSPFDGLVTNMLPNEQSHKEPNPLIERKTVINLPNINEVRRINQQLLTAEVSPIQMSNLADEVLNTGSQIASKLRKHSNETQNQVKSQGSNNSSNNVVTSIIETNKNIIDKQSDNVVPDTNRCPSNSQVTKSCVKQKIPQKRPRKQQPVVSWLTRHNEIVHVKDDVLLTFDTLNKMIQVMDGLPPPPPKTKNVLKRLGKTSRAPRAQTKQSNTDSNNETDEEKNTECSPQCVTNISSSGNPTKSRKPRPKRRNSKNLSRSKKSNLTLVDKEDSSKQPAVNIAFLSDHDVASNEVCVSSPVPSIKINIRQNLSPRPNDSVQSSISDPVNHFIIDQQNLLTKSNDTFQSTISDPVNHLLIDQQNSHSKSNDTIQSSISDPVNDLLIDRQNLPTRSNDTVQSSISDRVNHLLIDAPNDPKATSDASTTTSEQEVHTATQSVLPQTAQTVSCNPIFSVLPSPKLKRTRKPKPNIYQNRNKNSVKNVNVSELKSCSCQLPVVNANQKHLILDGSNYCALHGIDQSTNNYKTIIHQNVFKRIMSESSLRLSKDKILLSTVTFSKTNMLHVEGEDSSSLNKFISTPLPPGVQLVLPPNGELTYFIQPGVVLDEIQLAQLHTIIDAVKLKLPSKIVPISAQPICVSNEVVDLTADEVLEIETEKESSISDNVNNKNVAHMVTENTSTITDLDVVANVSVDNEQNTELLFITNENSGRFDIHPPNITNTTDDDLNIETEKCNKNSSLTRPSEQNSASELSSGDNPTLPVQSNTNYASSHSLLVSQINTTENDDPNMTSNQIEDTDSNKLSKVSDENLSTINRKSILSDLMEISGIGEDDIAPAPVPVPEVPPTVFPTEYSKPVINLNAGNVSIAPITSFKELKYAYENSATFFELNCVTGIIQKVNVCLTKTKSGLNTVPPAQPLITTTTPPPLQPIPQVSKVVKISPVRSKNVGNNRPKPIIIRKIEKFKSLNFKTMNKTKSSLLKPNLTNVRKALLRSKVKLYEKHKPPITLDITNDDSDSSDDEPLIKKAKRMKEISERDIMPSQTEKGNKIIDTNNQEIDRQMEVEYIEDEPLPSHNIDNGNINDDVGLSPEANDPALDDDQQVMENEPTEENDEDLIPIEELEEDASGEECILGV